MSLADIDLEMSCEESCESVEICLQFVVAENIAFGVSIIIIGNYRRSWRSRERSTDTAGTLGERIESIKNSLRELRLLSVLLELSRVEIPTGPNAST